MLGRRKERERKEGREGGMKEGRRNKKGKQESRSVVSRARDGKGGI